MREETLLQKAVIGTMFILFLTFWIWIPDFTLSEQDCAKQDANAYVGTLCSEPKAK